ncbi:hypothetical protein A2cp1_3690 [Anaeromyxobacter dehalogenans 2CP-1]|uniref:Toxin-antitoxin system HicB family antitoxin n=1 Tax=Anaeromyxobacter dehalogenans (strain ATCC BAA-258 / DSM 21875 / 2CP-1) TaxID=455488 RepID=B8J6P4_ANAD2|nr:hypothetical protein A2cp1_3690 [Anaeromyxobacter dehalogenans 2CP-1]
MTERRRPGRPRKHGAHKVVTCRLPLELHRALGHLAVDRGVPLNDIIVEGLRDFWARSPDRKKYAHLLPHLSGQAE